METGCICGNWMLWMRTVPRLRGGRGFAMCKNTLCIQSLSTFPGNGKSLAIFLTGRDGVSLHLEPLFSLLCVVVLRGWFYCNQIF